MGKRQQRDYDAAIKVEESADEQEPQQQQPQQKRQRQRRGGGGGGDAAVNEHVLQQQQQQQEEERQEEDQQTGQQRQQHGGSPPPPPPPLQQQQQQQEEEEQQQNERGANAAPAAAGQGQPADPQAGLQQAAADPATVTKAITGTTCAVLDCLIQSGRVAEDDKVVSAALISRALLPGDEQVAHKAAKALKKLTESLEPKTVVGTRVVSTLAAQTAFVTGSSGDGIGLASPLVAMMARGVAAAAGSAALALHRLVETYAKYRCPLSFVSRIMQQKGSLSALLRTVDLCISTTEGDEGERAAAAAAALSLLSKAFQECDPQRENAAKIVGNPAAMGMLLRALQLAPSSPAVQASVALNYLAVPQNHRVHIISALATESSLAALARLVKDTAGRDDNQAIFPLRLLEGVYCAQSSPAAVFAMFEQLGVLGAVAELLGHSQSREGASRMLVRIAQTEDHRVTIASAVAAALHACPPGDGGEAARQRLRTFLAAEPLSLSSLAIDTLLRSAGEAARLRAEVAVLEAVPINTRAAILELATAVRSKH